MTAQSILSIYSTERVSLNSLPWRLTRIRSTKSEKSRSFTRTKASTKPVIWTQQLSLTWLPSCTMKMKRWLVITIWGKLWLTPNWTVMPCPQLEPRMTISGCKASKRCITSQHREIHNSFISNALVYTWKITKLKKCKSSYKFLRANLNMGSITYQWRQLSFKEQDYQKRKPTTSSMTLWTQVFTILAVGRIKAAISTDHIMPHLYNHQRKGTQVTSVMWLDHQNWVLSSTCD